MSGTPPPNIKKPIRHTTDAKSLNVSPALPSEQQATSLVEKAVEKSLNFPSGIHINDIDIGFVRFVENNFKINSQGKDIPIYEFSRQRFFEHTQKWLNSDTTNTPELPIITVIRDSMAKKGTILGDTAYNIPSNETYTIFRVPVIRDGKQMNELYRIPQPVTVDVVYMVSIITTNMYDVDKFTEKMLLAFASKTAYSTVNDLYMPMTLEDESDKSEKDIEKRRYYMHQYTIKLKGYLLDECRFEAVESISDISLPITECADNSDRECGYELATDVMDGICFGNFKLNFSKTISQINISVPKDTLFEHDNQKAGNVTYTVDGTEQTFPFTVAKGNVLTATYNLEITRNTIVKLGGILS